MVYTHDNVQDNTKSVYNENEQELSVLESEGLQSKSPENEKHDIALTSSNPLKNMKELDASQKCIEYLNKLASPSCRCTSPHTVMKPQESPIWNTDFTELTDSNKRFDIIAYVWIIIHYVKYLKRFAFQKIPILEQFMYSEVTRNLKRSIRKKYASACYYLRKLKKRWF